MGSDCLKCAWRIKVWQLQEWQQQSELARVILKMNPGSMILLKEIFKIIVMLVLAIKCQISEVCMITEWMKKHFLLIILIIVAVRQELLEEDRILTINLVMHFLLISHLSYLKDLHNQDMVKINFKDKLSLWVIL